MKSVNYAVLSFRALLCLNKPSPLIYSSDPYYLIKLHYVIKGFLNSHCAITTFSLILIDGDCSILVTNAQGAAMGIWATNSFTGEKKLTESNSQLHDSDRRLCVGPIYGLDRNLCWQGQWIP